MGVDGFDTHAETNRDLFDGQPFSYQLQNFSDDSRVLAIDLRGHGQSDRPHTQYDMPSVQADLAAALKVLGVTEKIILVGHSFGGAIAMEYAAAHPERTRALILQGGEA